MSRTHLVQNRSDLPFILGNVLIAFTDIDKTVIFPREMCEGDDLDAGCVKPDGTKTMFLDSRHQAMLSLLGQCQMLVPTTARNYELFQRVTIPFYPGWAIITYGGIILNPEKKFDEAYLKFITPKAKAAEKDLLHLYEWVNSTYGTVGGFRNRLLTDAGMSFYFEGSTHQVSDAEKGFRGEFITSLKDHLPPGWQLRSNSNNILVCPEYLSKENAVRWFLDNIAPVQRTTIGFGDSYGDLPFMQLCDYILTPNQSQVAGLLGS